MLTTDITTCDQRKEAGISREAGPACWKGAGGSQRGGLCGVPGGQAAVGLQGVRRCHWAAVRSTGAGAWLSGCKPPPLVVRSPTSYLILIKMQIAQLVTEILI